MRVLMCLLASASVSSCIGSDQKHVKIPDLPPDLRPDQRVDAFQKFRQGGYGVETTTTCNRGCTTTKSDLLVLADGTIVHDADDLLPLLPPESPNARAAHEVAAVHRSEGRWNKVGWVMFLGGIGMIVGGVKLDVPAVTGTGIISVVLSPFVALGGRAIARWGLNDHTKAAFARYDEALAQRLHVCVNGLAVVACELNTPGNAPPPQRDPALDSLRQK